MASRRFRVVKTNDPAAVFDDIDALHEAIPSVATRRVRSTETFARIPHDRAPILRDVSGTGWLIMIELDRLILKGRGHNPVRLTNHRLRELGISRWAKQRALRHLEAAGAVRVETEARKWTTVTHLWFPVQT